MIEDSLQCAAIQATLEQEFFAAISIEHRYRQDVTARIVRCSVEGEAI